MTLSVHNTQWHGNCLVDQAAAFNRYLAKYPTYVLQMISKPQRFQYLDWELNVEPSKFEEMVRNDFAGPGLYPTYVLQTISKPQRFQYLD